MWHFQYIHSINHPQTHNEWICFYTLQIKTLQLKRGEVTCPGSSHSQMMGQDWNPAVPSSAPQWRAGKPAVPLQGGKNPYFPLAQPLRSLFQGRQSCACKFPNRLCSSFVQQVGLRPPGKQPKQRQDKDRNVTTGDRIVGEVKTWVVSTRV